MPPRPVAIARLSHRGGDPVKPGALAASTVSELGGRRRATECYLEPTGRVSLVNSDEDSQWCLGGTWSMSGDCVVIQGQSDNRYELTLDECEYRDRTSPMSSAGLAAPMAPVSVEARKVGNQLQLPACVRLPPGVKANSYSEPLERITFEHSLLEILHE